MPFYLSYANSAGLRLPSSDTLITPAPTYVNYPEKNLGEILATADGIPVVQQGNFDGRERSWVWQGYTEGVPGYTTLWNNLLSLRSRTRKESGAQTPYVFLKDTDTHRLRRRIEYKGTVTSATSSTLSDSGAPFPGSNALAGYRVEIIDNLGAGQIATVTTNTTTQLTITPNWVQTPNTTSKYSVWIFLDDWFKVRVVDVERVLEQVPTNPPRYATTSLMFALQDATYNDLG